MSLHHRERWTPTIRQREADGPVERERLVDILEQVANDCHDGS
jgi:hypothetical protein